jgi:DNA-directed RNA polymerase III subunit RPC11
VLVEAEELVDGEEVYAPVERVSDVLSGSLVRYYCQTCPYTYAIQSEEQTLVHPLPLPERKGPTAKGVEDDVFKSRQSTMAQVTIICRRCKHDKAYFEQRQIRSADEPTTLFFKCVKCNHGWREN